MEPNNAVVSFSHRKLIEGEDMRITSMVQGVMGMSAISARAIGVMGLGALGAGTGGAANGGLGAGVENGAHGQTIATYSQEQAVEMTERKTVLIW